jgi:3-deoxy-7-phosphoheptulonate synthase
MIIHLKEGIDDNIVLALAEQNECLYYKKNNQYIFINSSSVKQLPQALESYTESFKVLSSDIQLASKEYQAEKREIRVGEEIIFGGNSNNTIVITGPCSVESEEQLDISAQNCVKNGVKIIRAGCYKPRTSPYSFQGLGKEGLILLDGVRKKYGLKVITEVRDATHVEDVIEYADIIQIGAKAMYDQGILRACSEIRKPVLLKRGFGSTLQEFVQAAEFILSGGNEQVILCERGIRTFETKTRFTFDLCGVAYLKQYTNLPVVLDPSHAMGYAYGVADLARASVAMGVDGLLIETHPTPKIAKSDAAQQLDFNQFNEMYQSLEPIAKAVGKNLI